MRLCHELERDLKNLRLCVLNKIKIDKKDYESLNHLLSSYKRADVQCLRLLGYKIMEAAMSGYDEILHNMTELYEAAKKELAELERKRIQVQMTISKLSKVLGSDDDVADVATESTTASVKAGRKQRVPRAKKAVETTKGTRAARIREEDLRRDVLAIFDNASGSLSCAEIIEKLLQMNYPETASFKTRVYGKLSDWDKAGILNKVDRGVYQKI